MRKEPVLVIDDSFYDQLIAREMLEDFLEPEKIICVSSGAEALELFRQKERTPEELPGVVFLDIRMPVMDGFQFLEHFDRLPPGIREQCSLFVLSSSVDPADFNRAERNPHVHRFLEKPLSEKQIAEILGKA